jgi:hypothetical protein
VRLSPHPGAEDTDVSEPRETLPVPVSQVRPSPARRAREIAREKALAGTALPAVQAAAVAAGSFVAGAAVAGLVHRRQGRSPAIASGGRVGRALARGARRGVQPSAERVQIVGSRTLLVDVHLLGIPDAGS